MVSSEFPETCRVRLTKTQIHSKLARNKNLPLLPQICENFGKTVHQPYALQMWVRLLFDKFGKSSQLNAFFSKKIIFTERHCVFVSMHKIPGHKHDM